MTVVYLAFGSKEQAYRRLFKPHPNPPPIRGRGTSRWATQRPAQFSWSSILLAAALPCA